MRPAFTPTSDPAEIRRRLDRLLVSGALGDPGLTRRIDRLAARFAGFAESYPLPLWAPGLLPTEEMRSLSEALFPLSEVRPVFWALCRAACRFTPLLQASYLYGSASWLDFLHRFRPRLERADPAHTLARLARDGAFRERFLFALFLPQHFGATFERYPRQTRFLKRWLAGNLGRLGGRIRALDSACGSGEGSYDLARTLLKAGYREVRLDGTTLEHLELFAAAHAFFPHDPQRARAYRERVAPLLASEALTVNFYLEEVAAPSPERFEVILCNGLLGGPLLHDAGELAGAVAALAARLAPGGLLLAADRFHDGWRLKVPPERLQALFKGEGLVLREIEEGVAGERPR